MNSLTQMPRNDDFTEDILESRGARIKEFLNANVNMTILLLRTCFNTEVLALGISVTQDVST